VTYQQKPKDPMHGRLFTRQAEGNQPNWQGDLMLTPQMASELAQLAQQRGADVRIRISAWNKEGPKGVFISIAGQIDRLQPGDDPAKVLGPQQGYPQRQQPRQYQGGGQRTQGGFQQPAQRPAQPIRGGHFQTPQQPQGAPDFDDDVPGFERPSQDTPWRR
jgi:hypothetical protein